VRSESAMNEETAPKRAGQALPSLVRWRSTRNGVSLGGAPDEGGRNENARHGTGCSIEIVSSVPPRAYAQSLSAGIFVRKYVAPIDEFGVHGNVNLARGASGRAVIAGRSQVRTRVSLPQVPRGSPGTPPTRAGTSRKRPPRRDWRDRPDAPGQLRYGPRARSIYATTGARRRSKLVALVLHNSWTPRHGLGQRARSKSFFARRRTPHPAGAELGLTRLTIAGRRWFRFDGRHLAGIGG
jgi:hypothetical protein